MGHNETDGFTPAIYDSDCAVPVLHDLSPFDITQQVASRHEQQRLCDRLASHPRAVLTRHKRRPPPPPAAAPPAAAPLAAAAAPVAAAASPRAVHRSRNRRRSSSHRSGRTNCDSQQQQQQQQHPQQQQQHPQQQQQHPQQQIVAENSVQNRGGSPARVTLSETQSSSSSNNSGSGSSNNSNSGSSSGNSGSSSSKTMSSTANTTSTATTTATAAATSSSLVHCSSQQKSAVWNLSAPTSADITSSSSSSSSSSSLSSSSGQQQKSSLAASAFTAAGVSPARSPAPTLVSTVTSSPPPQQQPITSLDTCRSDVTLSDVMPASVDRQTDKQQLSLSALVSDNEEVVLSPRGDLSFNSHPTNPYSDDLIERSHYLQSPIYSFSSLSEPPSDVRDDVTDDDVWSHDPPSPAALDTAYRTTSRRYLRQCRSGNVHNKASVSTLKRLIRTRSDPQLFSGGSRYVDLQMLAASCGLTCQSTREPSTLASTVQQITNNMSELSLVVSGGGAGADRSQLLCTKVRLQRALLYLESVFGRPQCRSDRDLVRPLYDRYRLLKRQTASPVGSRECAVTGASNELTTIKEHETLDLPRRCPPSHTSSSSPSSSAAAAAAGGGGVYTPPQSSPAVASLNPHCDAPCDQQSTPQQQQQQQLQLQQQQQLQQQNNFNKMTAEELREQLVILREQRARLKATVDEFEAGYNNRRDARRDGDKRMQLIYYEYRHVRAQLKLVHVLLAKSHRRSL